MLNKEVCKNCWNRNQDKEIIPWSEFCEQDWKRGLVYCHWKGYYLIGDNPPNECKYKLEHLVMKNE